jgi:hypothetical protein
MRPIETRKTHDQITPIIYIYMYIYIYIYETKNFLNVLLNAIFLLTKITGNAL